MTEILTSEYLLWLGRRLDERQEIQVVGRGEVEPGERWERSRRDGFIEEYLRIRTKIANQKFFRLNRVQQEYAYKCGKQNIVLKARQVGITTYVAARFFVQTITQPGTLSMQVTQDRDSAEDIFRIVLRFWENLPEYLRKGYLKTSHRSVRQLIFPNLDSEYSLTQAGENAGRGRTIQNLHCSEVSRWGREGDEALASLRAAVVPGGEVVLESTPNGAGGLFYEEWERAEETGYVRHFFPWWYDPSYALEVGPCFAPLTLEEAALAAANGLKVEQIAWRRKQWASLRGLAEQEYAEDPTACFLASGECVFDLEMVARALGVCPEPQETRENERLMIWLPAQAGREYVIGVDPAGGGTDGDYSCAEVIDRKLGTQCAELRGHYAPRELAKLVAGLGKEYNGALVAVERNNHGFGVLAHLGTLGYVELFEENGQEGWWTSVRSRPLMIENLVEALNAGTGMFRSARLLNECRTFIRWRDGVARGAPGTHDDCVMAMGIAWSVRGSEAGKAKGVGAAAGRGK